MPTSTTDDLREQLALKDHINTYHWLADTFQWKDWSNLLSEDTVFEGVATGFVARGRKQALELLQPAIEDYYQRTQHIIVNLMFELADEKTATGHGNLLFTGVPHADKPQIHYTAGGFYQWRFVKTDRWRTQHTRLEFIWEGGTTPSNFNVGPIVSSMARPPARP